MKTAFLKLLAVSSLAVSALAPASAMAAGSASLTLGASATQVTNGSTVVVSVYENGTDVNVVTAKLTYDASKLSCGAVAVSGAFANKAAASCGGGSVTMSHYTNPGTVAPAGSLVGTVTFTAIADSGSAVVATAAGSQVASAGTNMWNGATSSVSVALAAAPVVTPEPGTPGRGEVPAENKQTTTTKQAAVAGTNNASSTDTSSAATDAPKAEEKQVATAVDEKKASNTQTAAPAAAKSNGKAMAFVGILAVATAAALAYIYRQKLSTVLHRAKEA